MNAYLTVAMTLFSTELYKPCEDTIYVDIKKKQLNEMSDREYKYFLRADLICKEYLIKHQNEAKKLKPISTLKPARQVNAVYQGPRFGVTYLTGDLEFSETIKFDAPVTTQFGWQYEHRIFGEQGQTIGLIELVGLVGGMEQGYVLPSLNTIVGLRKPSGIEAGFGPNLSLSGVGYVFAVGFSHQKGGLVFPHNLSLALSNDGFRISYITGFNSFYKRRP